MAFNNLFAGLGGGVSGFYNDVMDSLFPDASKQAMPYLDQISGTMKPYYQPYMDAGSRSLGPLEGAYGQMLNDPGSLIKRMGAGYQQSPGFEFARNQGLQGIENASAAGGMLGSGQHQQQAGELATNLANQDYGQYLDRAMGLYGQGVSGYGNLASMGQQSSSELAQSLAQALMSQASLRYAGQANQNQMTGGLLGNIIGAFGGGGNGGGMGRR